jgi:site-specific DNA-methyltransferase (adenine-specific)
MDADSIDAIVTDPPYGLSFMGKGWDHGVPGVEFWTEAMRVAKPGAHLLAFGGTRTFHRLTCAIEDAGWEIRDCVMWLYGSGFPKSLDVSKALDKAAGVDREVVGMSVNRSGIGQHGERTDGTNWWVRAEYSPITAPATDAARRWSGWGTALKPAWEPVIVARKPLQGTIAANVLKHGTGAINVDACRVGTEGGCAGAGAGPTVTCFGDGLNGTFAQPVPGLGRWPANVIHDGSEEVVSMFPANAGASAPVRGTEPTANGFSGAVKFSGMRARVSGEHTFRGDIGSAARFFYTAKADRSDRDEGLQHRDSVIRNITNGHGRAPINTSKGDGNGVRENRPIRNSHPTVKPVDLMRYLCRLVTPPGGTILDPFCGSGSTGKAALLEGFHFVGIEIEDESAAIARDRIYAAAPLFAGPIGE